MKVAVVGAGTVGTTTAYELARDGHQVTVFERRSSCAEEGSFAHPGWCTPAWPAVVAPQPHKPALQWAWPLTWAETRWWWSHRRATATPPPQSMALARYSHERLLSLLHDLNLQLEHSTGALLLWRRAGAAPAVPGLQTRLTEAGVAHRLLNPAQAYAVEPGLHRATPLHQALLLPEEGGYNARQFTLQLKSEATRLGVTFRFNTTVKGLQTGEQARVQWQADDAMVATETPFDAVVVCAGPDSTHMLRTAGLMLPMVRVWGRSISVPVQEAMDAPQGTVFDVEHGATITRLGQWVRIAAGMRLGGGADGRRDTGFQQLYRLLGDWFPGTLPRQRRGASTTPTLEWTGARAFTLDKQLRLGPSGLPGVWLNTGHGGQGWALACGSARVLADQIKGTTPAVDWRS